jgi:hypothetical protein
VTPSRPDAETCGHLVSALAELVAAGGAGSLLAPPVVPTGAAFPERWRATPTGVVLLLRRLAWHARLDADIALRDDRVPAPPTERRPPTRVELVRVRGNVLELSLVHLGRDDIGGTLAHEIGVAHVLLARRTEGSPYRTAAAAPDAEVAEDDEAATTDAATPIDDADLERGSIATVYLGLGVLAANAAFQQYSSGRWTGGYAALEYDVLRAGYVEMSDLAFLLAVQAVVRGGRKPSPPPGLSPPQRDEVVAWIAALRRDGNDLRARLGIAADAITAPAQPVEAFDDAGEPAGEGDASAQRIAFRWRSHRAGAGFLVGGAVGFALAIVAPARPLAIPLGLLAAATGFGYATGRRTQQTKCSRCLASVRANTACCSRCNSALRGDIARLDDRLEAEEMLSTVRPPSAS